MSHDVSKRSLALTMMGVFFILQGVRVIGVELADAWESSTVSQPWHSRRGHDPSVISDEMIQNAVATILGHEKEE